MPMQSLCSMHLEPPVILNGSTAFSESVLATRSGRMRCMGLRSTCSMQDDIGYGRVRDIDRAVGLIRVRATALRKPPVAIGPGETEFGIRELMLAVGQAVIDSECIRSLRCVHWSASNGLLCLVFVSSRSDRRPNRLQIRHMGALAILMRNVDRKSALMVRHC